MKKKEKLPDEFVIEQDASNSFKLTYRCMSFSICCEGDGATESECAFMDVVARTLNDHYPRSK